MRPKISLRMKSRRRKSILLLSNNLLKMEILNLKLKSSLWRLFHSMMMRFLKLLLLSRVTRRLWTYKSIAIKGSALKKRMTDSSVCFWRSSCLRKRGIHLLMILTTSKTRREFWLQKSISSTISTEQSLGAILSQMTSSEPYKVEALAKAITALPKRKKKEKSRMLRPSKNTSTKLVSSTSSQNSIGTESLNTTN